MTNTHHFGRTARLAIAGAGIVAVLGTGAVAASAASALGISSGRTSTGALTSAGTGGRTASTASTGSTGSTVSTATGTTAAGRVTGSSISYRQAIRIAKKRVPGARVGKVEREWEHGRRVWKVELHKRGVEYRVYVSVRTGAIVKFRQKHDDD
ncbi:PepSY domain-containing protein [Sphaerisporangium rhizosphaerae]|uniref:PepSY domain-containing protein n=1 Tax=Sphaerisporangium rhizosphaerae TaxID=2269375 RepID=A0ABW2NU47_9ACTN